MWRNLGFAAAMSATGTSGILLAQQSSAGRPPSVGVDSTVAPGPAFFTVRASDGERVDARNAPALQRRISLTLIGIPLGMAVQAIADRAGLEAIFGPETIPLGARVSMKADDVTVASALRWVLAKARVDVLIENDTFLTLIPKTNLVAGEDSSGVLAGELLDSETGEPVPYGTVTLLGTELARFTDPTGHFRMARLVARRYVLRARQIGYSPVDSTVAVGGGSTTQLTVRMRRVPAMLHLVRVESHRTSGCVATGVPDSTVDPALAAIFGQIRENVDRYDLLLEKYPFRYVRVEQRVLRSPQGAEWVEWADTVSYESSQERRPYRTGGVIYRDSVIHQDSVFGDRPVPGGSIRVFTGMRTTRVERRRVMYQPTFADLVDSAFLAAHCFEYGGTTGKEGPKQLIRVDFQPAKSIKTPDISGSVFLDADSLVLRRAVFKMTKPEAAKPPVLGFSVTTSFREILPLVPIVGFAEAVQPEPFARTALESDTLIGFVFTGLTPGEQSFSPPERETVASAPRHDTAGATIEPILVANPNVARVSAVFPADSSCRPTPPVDSDSVMLYGTLHKRRACQLSDTAQSTFDNPPAHR